MAATDQHHTDEPSAAVTPQQAPPAAGRHGVGPRAEPSAEWGWHGTFPRATAIAGWITALAMFAMLIGNHRSFAADAVLVFLGTVLVIMLISGHVSQLRSRRR